MLQKWEPSTCWVIISLLLGMRQCILLGTGPTWSAEWGRIVAVMPSHMPPCQENPLLCSTWLWQKTSPITSRLEAIAAGFCDGSSHFTTPWRIVKHWDLLFCSSAQLTNGLLLCEKTIRRPLNCESLWEQPPQHFLLLFILRNGGFDTPKFHAVKL